MKQALAIVLLVFAFVGSANAATWILEATEIEVNENLSYPEILEMARGSNCPDVLGNNIKRFQNREQVAVDFNTITLADVSGDYHSGYVIAHDFEATDVDGSNIVVRSTYGFNAGSLGCFDYQN